MTSDDRKQDFLDELRERGLVTKAARALRIAMPTISRWRKHDRDFEQAYQDALFEHAETLEEAAIKRAVDGIEHDVFNKDGELTGHKVVYSDSLLSKLLDGALPHKYASRVKQELSGPNGAPIAVDDTTTAAKLAMIFAAARERMAQGAISDDDPLLQ